ncbi:MAG: hypothetical protein ABJB17_04915 [Burkholderiales bacterium]
MHTADCVRWGAAVACVNERRSATTMQYTALEYFLREAVTPQPDLFSLGVLAHQILTGRLPYGIAVLNARTRTDQRKLRYVNALAEDRDIPVWIDAGLERALQPDPHKRHQGLYEFVFDLRQPNALAMQRRTTLPLLERNPSAFWRWPSLTLGYWFCG